MLQENEVNEIKKFFLNSLKLSLDSHQSRVNLLRSARDLPSKQIILQTEKYGIEINDMRTIYAAFQAATVHTQNKVQVTEESIGEITEAIHAYQDEILPQLLNDYNPKVSLIPWRTIKANIENLDQNIKVEGFTEKYSTELKLAGIGLGLLGIIAFGLFAAVNGGVDVSHVTPPPPSI